MGKIPGRGGMSLKHFSIYIIFLIGICVVDINDTITRHLTLSTGLLQRDLIMFGLGALSIAIVFFWAYAESPIFRRK